MNYYSFSLDLIGLNQMFDPIQCWPNYGWNHWWKKPCVKEVTIFVAWVQFYSGVHFEQVTLKPHYNMLIQFYTLKPHNTLIYTLHLITTRSFIHCNLITTRSFIHCNLTTTRSFIHCNLITTRSFIYCNLITTRSFIHCNLVITC